MTLTQKRMKEKETPELYFFRSLRGNFFGYFRPPHCAAFHFAVILNPFELVASLYITYNECWLKQAQFGLNNVFNICTMLSMIRISFFFLFLAGGLITGR